MPTLRDSFTSLFVRLPALLLGLAAAQGAIAGPLLPLPGDTIAKVRGSSNFGAVGYSYHPGGPINAVFWDNAGIAYNLSNSTFAEIARVANAINDVGQIVGTGSACVDPGFPCESVMDDLFGIAVGAVGIGAVAWVAPGSSAALPLLPEPCNADGLASAIDNLGYTYDPSNRSLRSANIGTQPLTCRQDLLEGTGINFAGNGVTVLPDGTTLLHDPFVDFFFNTETGVAIPEQVGSRQWVVAPTCTGSEPAHALDADWLLVSNTIKTTICNLAGQQVTPMPEPATLALLGVALAGLGFARRRKMH